MDNLGNYLSKALDNQFRTGVQYPLYQKVCHRNLKLLRRLDQVNLENLGLTEKVKELNNHLENLDLELNNLESNFKALNNPFNNCLESINCWINNDSTLRCSYSVISLLTLLFISLFNNLLGLNKQLKEIISQLKERI